MSFTGPLAERISPKWIIMFGQTVLAVATVLLALADSPEKYWSYAFPGLVLGYVDVLHPSILPRS